jgi:hypothetical protein
MAALEASIAASTERMTPTKKKRSKLKKEA